MGKLVFANTGQEREVVDGDSIYEVCEEEGIPFACNAGVCGTCVIDVEEGMENLSEYTQEEKDFLGEKNTERLACQCRLKKGRVKIRY